MFSHKRSRTEPFRIVALITVRNEEAYLERCIRHLIEEGVEVCVIDNGSEDGSREIAQAFLGRGVIRCEELPYHGYFDLADILTNEESLAREIDADWFIHQDADEIRQAPAGFGSLREAIGKVDNQGYDAINFDEFVFLPVSEDDSFFGTDYVRGMRHYYFFQPRPNHHVKAWKATDKPVRFAHSGGHSVEFEGRRIFPINFTLRHYIGLSKRHLEEKYCTRQFSLAEVGRGWHRERAFILADEFQLPSKDKLKEYDGIKGWDRSNPTKVHLFFKNTNKRIAEHLPDRRPPAPFVVGVARSGTTLLRLMLDAHPLLAIPEETHLPYTTFTDMGDGETQIERFISLMTGNYLWREFHLDSERYCRELRSLKPFSISEGLRLFYYSYAYRFRKPRWGDKTPPYCNYMDKIARILPEAHFIHIIRDGRDVAVSSRKMWWGLGENIARHAANWQNRIRQSREQAKKLPYYLEVRYEHLVTEPEKTLKTICEFIKLPYESRMLDYYLTAEERLSEIGDRMEPDGSGTRFVTKEETLAIHEMNKYTPASSRIGRWKRELSKNEIEVYQRIAGGLLRELGYDIH